MNHQEAGHLVARGGGRPQTVRGRCDVLSSCGSGPARWTPQAASEEEQRLGPRTYYTRILRSWEAQLGTLL